MVAAVFVKKGLCQIKDSKKIETGNIVTISSKILNESRQLFINQDLISFISTKRMS